MEMRKLKWNMCLFKPVATVQDFAMIRRKIEKHQGQIKLEHMRTSRDKYVSESLLLVPQLSRHFAEHHLAKCVNTLKHVAKNGHQMAHISRDVGRRKR